MSQYIYLLQEREFINTNEDVYKVGMTKKENNERCNQYPTDSVLLFQMICYNCKHIKNQLIKLFTYNFKQRTDIGNEYFEGEYKNMIDIIYSTIKNEKNIQEEPIVYYEEQEYQEDEDNKLKYNLLCEKICKIFPYYKNDESFGGNKKFIKMNIIDNEYVVYYINPRLMEHLQDYYENVSESRFDEYIIIQYEINKNVSGRFQYVNNLISKKIVCLDKTYDINSNNFIYKINTTKFDIKNKNYDDFQIRLKNNKFYCKITEKISQIFHYNTIVDI